MTSGKRHRKLLPLKMSISGHEFDRAISRIDVYLSSQPMKPKFPRYNSGPGGNELRLFFQARNSEAELTISDEGAMPEIPAGNYINAAYDKPNKDEVKNMMINFIQIQPVLAPESWHGKAAK